MVPCGVVEACRVAARADPCCFCPGAEAGYCEHANLQCPVRAQRRAQTCSAAGAVGEGGGGGEFSPPSHRRWPPRPTLILPPSFSPPPFLPAPPSCVGAPALRGWTFDFAGVWPTSDVTQLRCAKARAAWTMTHKVPCVCPGTASGCVGHEFLCAQPAVEARVGCVPLCPPCIAERKRNRRCTCRGFRDIGRERVGVLSRQVPLAN